MSVLSCGEHCGQVLTYNPSFTSLGEVKKGDKQRMYKYALIDPVDEPYVTFKYTCRPSGKC